MAVCDECGFGGARIFRKCTTLQFPGHFSHVSSLSTRSIEGRDGRWDRDPMGLLSRDASPGLGTGTGTDFFGTLGTGTDFSGTSRDLGFAWDLCPNNSS